MPYIDLLRSAYARLFISRDTMNTYASRIGRLSESVHDAVACLGADGLTAPRQTFSQNRKIISCIGAFDGKKGQDLVFKAFSNLECGLELHFAGKIPQYPDLKYKELLETKDPRVTVHGDVSDEALTALISSARASVFVSENEGFGLPALESLFIGVPLIASATLPSLEDLPTLGQIRIETVNSESIRSALALLSNDIYVSQLWAEVPNLQLPTWADFGEVCRSRLMDAYVSS